jgi:hypothetical protein
MTTGKILRMADIQTSDILFYDPEFKKQCYDFCTERNIDCLPALDDSKKIYFRNEATLGFIGNTLTKDRIASSNLNIFAPEMLKRFREQHLLLVYNGDDLTGVVHFCDYNKPVVSLYLYELFFAYEKALRALLIQHKLNNEEMISYFKKKGEENSKKKKLEDAEHYQEKIENYQERDSKKKVPPFEVFYLTDLVALINHKKIIKINNVGKLRNMVMHVNEFVNMADPRTEDQIYDFKTFQEFFGLTLQLHLDFKRVSNRLAFTPEN